MSFIESTGVASSDSGSHNWVQVLKVFGQRFGLIQVFVELGTLLNPRGSPILF